MISSATLYPEFDSAEIRETIEPLSVFDAVIRAKLSTTNPDVSDPALPSAATDWSLAPEEYPFQQVIRRLALPAAHDLVSGRPAGMFTDVADITVQVLARAESRIRDAATRTLVASVNKLSAEGALRGSTPEERYDHFVKEAWPESLAGFPALSSAIAHLVRNTRASAQELFDRLGQDRDELSRRFGIGAHDRLASIGESDGDAHAHGRAVSILTFASGMRLVYKPRDVSCEAAFEEIADRVNAVARTALPAARTLKRDGYGYVEYVQAEDVSDLSAPFMRACGQLAAVLYLLDARDMHFENILPTRRGPVPVDLETLMHPARVHTGPKPEADGNAYDAVARSVYGIGILPLVLAGKGEGVGHVDLGFLGGDNQGVSPFKSMVFENPFTDRIRVRLRARPAERRSTVVRERSEEDIHYLAGQMADGFTKVCQAVRRKPSWWTDLLRRIAPDLRVRYIHNPTSLYAQTLRMAASAAAMADPRLATALLKRIAIASKLSDRDLVGSELVQMAERDVPYFTVRATGTAVHDCDGANTGARLLETPLSRVLKKTEALDEHAIEQQLRMLYSTFCSRFPDNHLSGRTTWGAHTSRTERSGLARIARTLADDLVATHVPDQFAHLPSTWIGPLASAQSARPWPTGVLGYDLYTGRTGPALALAVAGTHFGDDGLLRVAWQVFAPSAAILAENTYEERSVRHSGAGAYTGVTGLLLALSTAGRLLDEPGWVRTAQEALPLVTEQLEPVDSPDVISGVAGTAAMIAAIGGAHGAEVLNTLAARLVRSVAEPRGAWWEQSGFAHGVSGVLYTLAVLRRHVGDRVDPALAALMDRLADFHDEREANWFTNSQTPDRFSTGWCHGAAGIALALHEVSRTTGDARAAAWLDSAIDNTFRLGLGRNLTWCHGDLGNIDILHRIAAATGDRRLRDRTAAAEEQWLRPGVISQKLSDRTSRYAHTNSALVGTSGVLLHLVRRLDRRLWVSPIPPGAV